MKILICAILLLSSIFAAAQTTVTIPAADGKTILNTNGILSCPASAGAGSTVSYANGIITINGTVVTALSLNSLSLLNGVAKTPGNYLATFDAVQNLTWTPYVAPGAGVTTTFITVKLAATSNVQPGGVVKSTFTSPAGAQRMTVLPLTYPGDPWDFEVFAGIVRARNVSAVAIAFPATTVTVAVN